MPCPFFQRKNKNQNTAGKQRNGKNLYHQIHPFRFWFKQDPFAVACGKIIQNFLNLKFHKQLFLKGGDNSCKMSSSYSINGQRVSKAEFLDFQEVLQKAASFIFPRRPESNNVGDIFADQSVTETEITQFLDFDANVYLDSNDFRLWPQGKGATLFGDMSRLFAKYKYHLSSPDFFSPPIFN